MTTVTLPVEVVALLLAMAEGAVAKTDTENTAILAASTAVESARAAARVVEAVR